MLSQKIAIIYEKSIAKGPLKSGSIVLSFDRFLDHEH